MEKEDFVTYEQAEKLKELEFGELVFYCYTEGDETLKVGEEPINWNNGVSFLSAPTLAQVQKWLRKEKNLFVEPRLFYDKFHTDCKSPLRSKYWEVEHGKNYFSYEEALSAGINECIKLLENEKIHKRT